MEEEGRNVIVPKTQAQLKKDFFWVNLQQIEKSPRFSLPQKAIENPKDFQEEMKYLRQNPDILKNSPYARYDDYLQALRRLRREQKSDLQPIDAKGISIREEYLESRGFAPRIASKILKAVNEVPAYSDEKTVYTNAEFKRAVKSEKDFLEVLNAGLDRQPNAFYRGIYYLTHVLPPERIKEIIDLADTEGGKINYGFMCYFDTLKSLFTPAEQKRHIDAELKIDHNPTWALNLFREPEVTRLFTPQEVHSIVIQNFKERNVDIDPRLAKYYIDHGVMTRDELTQVALHYVNKLGSIGKFSEKIFPLLPNDQSRQEIKAAILDTYTNRANAMNSRWLSTITDMFTSDEIFQMVSSIALRDRSGALGHIHSYERMVSPENFAPILREILTTPDLQIDDYTVECVLLAESITEEEKEQFVDQLISNNRESLILDRDCKGFYGFKDDERRNRVARKVLLKCDVRRVAKTYYSMGVRGWRQDVSNEVLIEVINIARFSEADAWISQLRNWGEDLSASHPEHVLSILEKYRDTSAEALFDRLKIVTRYLPEGSKLQFVQDLIRTNPIAALVDAYETSVKGNEGLLSGAGITVTPEQIMQLLKEDQNRLSFAPKTFKEFIKKYNSQSTPEEQLALLIEASHIYKSIAFIKALGLEAEFRKIQSQSELSSSGEKDLLSTFYCFAFLKDRDPQEFSELKSLGGSLEEAKIILFNQISRILTLEKQPNQEEVDRFFGTMESPVPFMMYSLQYEKSSIHKELLKTIFESIAQGKFSEWKYGEPTQESLDQLKRTGLLPESLSLQQYLDWRTDGQVSLVDSLATDSKATANAIANYLEGNLHHLHIEELMENLLEKSQDQDPLSVIKAEDIAIGKKLALIYRELADTTKAGEDKEKIEKLEEEKLFWKNKRKDLLRVRKIFRLIMIKPNEVALGYFFEGKDGKQRGELVNDVLKELETDATEEDRFVYGAVKNMITSSNSSSNEKQNMICTDSSDPKVWLEIGENPVASCQSYAGGGHNDCLVAYTDPNTKILILRNEKGSIIARSIFRLLTSTDGTPALHIERIYSSSTSKAVSRIIYTRAYQKAQEMGLPLLVSEHSQDEEGAEKELQASDDYQTTKINYSLISKSSRAPKVYVDSAGGVARGGAYEMTNLLEIKK